MHVQPSSSVDWHSQGTLLQATGMQAFRKSPQTLRTSLISPEASPRTSMGSPQALGGGRGGGFIRSPEELAQSPLSVTRSPQLSPQETGAVMLHREDTRLNAGLNGDAQYATHIKFIYSFFHSFIHSFIYSFIHSFIHSFICMWLAWLRSRQMIS